MATYQWLFDAHADGFDSGEITAKVSDTRRAKQEAQIGGSYYEVFERAIRPYVKPDSRVLELGPGKGSWTRALLALVPHGEVHTVDIHDTTRFMDPTAWQNRLHCHQVTENDYHFLPDGHFDFFFSFGVLCHLSQSARMEVLEQSLPKVRRGGFAVHQYGDWKKIAAMQQASNLLEKVKDLSETESWWPRNNALNMSQEALQAGWAEETPDLGLLKRDGLIVLCRL